MNHSLSRSLSPSTHVPDAMERASNHPLSPWTSSGCHRLLQCSFSPMHVICYLMPIACSGVNSLEENVYCDVYFISRGYLCDPLEIIKKKVLLMFSSKNTFYLFLKKIAPLYLYMTPAMLKKKKRFKKICQISLWMVGLSVFLVTLTIFSRSFCI